MRLFSAAAGVVLAAALTGCSGAGTTTPAGPPCVPHPVLGSGILIAPAPNATNVPTSVGTVTVAYQAQLVGKSVMLQPNGSGTILAGGSLTPSADGTTMSASVPALAPATMYFVESAYSLAPCEGVTVMFGTFTTR